MVGKATHTSGRIECPRNSSYGLDGVRPNLSSAMLFLLAVQHKVPVEAPQK